MTFVPRSPVLSKLSKIFLRLVPCSEIPATHSCGLDPLRNRDHKVSDYTCTQRKPDEVGLFNTKVIEQFEEIHVQIRAIGQWVVRLVAVAVTAQIYSNQSVIVD